MSTITGNVVLTYDVNSRHAEVKAALKDKGYLDSVNLSNINYPLPSTTVWKQYGTADEANRDVLAVCNKLGVALYSAVSVIATDWQAFSTQTT